MKFKKLECGRCVAGGVSVIKTKLQIRTQLEPLGLHTLDVLFFKQIIYMKSIFFEQLIGQMFSHRCKKATLYCLDQGLFWGDFRTAKQPHQLNTMVVKRRMARPNTGPISALMTDKGKKHEFELKNSYFPTFLLQIHVTAGEDY